VLSWSPAYIALKRPKTLSGLGANYRSVGRAYLGENGGMGTITCTPAQSYVDRAATGVGAVWDRKLAKYSNRASNFIFQPIAVENLLVNFGVPE